MKKLTVILAGASALVAANAAHAAPTITYTPGANGAFGATYTSTPGTVGSFTDTFAAFMVGATSNQLSGTFSTSDPMKFTSAAIYMTGLAAPVSTFSFSSFTTPVGVTYKFGSLMPVSLAAGSYYLKVAGTTSTQFAGYAGTLNFTAAPEPATWSLMIIGFGVVGFAMRRQRSTYRVAYT